MSDNFLNLKAQEDIFRFVLKAKSAIQKCTRQVLIEIGMRLVMRSPVGNPAIWHPPYWPKGYVPGSFINNWQLGVDVPASGIIFGQDPSGTASLARMQKSIPRWPVGHTYYFTNNLPYARILETGLHSSQVGPGGMVGLTVLEFHQIVRQAEVNYAKGD